MSRSDVFNFGVTAPLVHSNRQRSRSDVGLVPTRVLPVAQDLQFRRMQDMAARSQQRSASAASAEQPAFYHQSAMHMRPPPHPRPPSASATPSARRCMTVQIPPQQQIMRARSLPASPQNGPMAAKILTRPAEVTQALTLSSSPNSSPRPSAPSVSMSAPTTPVARHAHGPSMVTMQQFQPQQQQQRTGPSLPVDWRSIRSSQQLAELWNARGHMVTFPTMPDGSELPVGNLIATVNNLGGILAVRTHRRWGQVAANLRLGSEKPVLNKLKKFYAKYVHPLEREGILSHPEYTKPAGKRPSRAVDTSAAMSTDQSLSANKKKSVTRRHSSKRLKQWRLSAPSQTRAVYDAVMSARLLLVEERDTSMEAKGMLQHHFTLLAADGAIHSVCISQTHSCSCAEYVGKRTLCHHIYFVLFKVLKLPPYAPCLSQPALSPKDLAEILDDSNRTTLTQPRSTSIFSPFPPAGLPGVPNGMAPITLSQATSDLSKVDGDDGLLSLSDIVGMDTDGVDDSLGLGVVQQEGVPPPQLLTEELPIKMDAVADAKLRSERLAQRQRRQERAPSVLQRRAAAYLRECAGAGGMLPPPEDCPICLSSINDPAAAVSCGGAKCGKSMHKSCFHQWSSFHFSGVGDQDELCPCCGSSWRDIGNLSAVPPEIAMDMDTTPSAYVNLDFEKDVTFMLDPTDDAYADPYYSNFGSRLSMVTPGRLNF